MNDSKILLPCLLAEPPSYVLQVVLVWRQCKRRYRLLRIFPNIPLSYAGSLVREGRIAIVVIKVTLQRRRV